MNKNNHELRSEEAAGAGIAALALLSRLVETLVSNRRLTGGELREALDAALLSLERAQADSPVPAASDCARRCLEQLVSGTRAR
jgi:hypothetical protein